MQLVFIGDIKRSLGKRKLRILFIWITRAFVDKLLCSFEQSLFLVFRKYYTIIRAFF